MLPVGSRYKIACAELFNVSPVAYEPVAYKVYSS